MKKKVLLVLNPQFEEKFPCGISRLYQIFCKKGNFRLSIVDFEYLQNYIPNDDNTNILVIAGGDGTIHKVVNTIPKEVFEKYLFGLLPGGTANEFMNSLGLHFDLYQCAEIIANSNKIINHRLGEINGKNIFVTGVIYGITTQVLINTTSFIKFYFGEYAYQLRGIRDLYNYQDFVKDFWAGDLNFKTGYLLINNANLLSRKLPLDGLKDFNVDLFSFIYINPDINTADLIRLVLKNQAGVNVLLDTAVNYEQLEKIELKFKGETNFMVDGEFYAFDSPVEIKHFDKRMRIITR
jgi:diacylglycerol kinase family enzyme